MHVRSDRTYTFDQPPAEVWAAIGRVDDYRRWWPWLCELDARGVVEGDVWRCAVRPPVPYTLRFDVSIVGADEPERIDAEVDGDIEGEARLDLDATADGCRVRLRSSLMPARQPLRTVAGLAPWLARFGHDWVLDVGSRQFASRAL